MIILWIILWIVIIAAVVGVIAGVADIGKKSTHKPYGPYERFFKRPLDAFLATGAIIVLSPIWIVVAILVRIKLGSPVLFTQERPGKDEKIFRLYKFRTMTDERDEKGALRPDSERMTSFGKKLRATSIDELPELFNILRGDMSVIGPRPLIPSYLPFYSQEERHRHDVRPGLSGLAQSKGRSFISWEKIFQYDLEYVRHITLASDFQIVLDTVRNLFSKEDVVDFSQIYIGEDGKKHIKIGNEDCIIHMPLDEERAHIE